MLALAAWIAAGSERIAYAGIQIGFTFALAFLSWFAQLTNLTELRDRVLGILLGVLVSSIVHLYLSAGQRSAAAETYLAARYRRLADCLIRPEEAVPAAPLLARLATDSEALIHRVRAEPLGTYAHPGPGERLADARHPRPGRGDRPPQRRLLTTNLPRREARP